MKKSNKLLTMLAVLVFALSLLAVPAFAASEIAGPDSITFDKYLTMDANANVPNAEFQFAITSGTAVSAVTNGTATPAVMAGPAGALLTYGEQNAATVTVSFQNGDTTYDAQQSGDTVTLAADTKYAVETVAVNLTGVVFTRPGIYRYNITETGTNDGITNDTTATRYLDVFIESDENGDLSYGGSILHNTAVVAAAANGSYGTNKDGGFTNAYTTYDLSFAKNVSGNQAFRSQYFAFTVTITGADPGTGYTIDLNSASTDDGDGNQNPTTLTADNMGAVTGTFYLKNGETITIYGLTAATEYVISEDAEDYTPSYQLDTGDAVNDDSTPENVAMGTSNHLVTFENYRNGTVPTGILVDTAPYALVVLLAAAAAVLMIVRKRRSTDN